MTSSEYFFRILLALQFFHSIEELSNQFHERFPLFKMKFSTFLTFEVLFFGFWVIVFFYKEMSYRETFMAAFNVLMFTNGLWHVVWWAIVKKYVSGLLTAPLFVIVFLVFYFRMI